MRIVAALSAAVLMVLLTWLSMRAFNLDAERFDLVLGQLDRFGVVEADLHGNILSARAGLLRNYDPLVRDINELDVLLQRMRSGMADDPVIAAAIDRLSASVRRQEDLTEQFKSNNALLQNSLAYFALFSAQMSAPHYAYPLAAEVSALAAAMLHLTLDSSSASGRDVRERLAELAQRVGSADSASPAPALVAHGRLLYELLPATDGLLKTLEALPRPRDQEAVHTLLLSRQLASRTTARQFRSLLYLISLLLVGLLVHVALQLRLRAMALRRRAAFEHVLAGISMRFITARGADLDPIIEQALAEMAACVGADRGYFVAAGAVTRTSVWCRPGLAFPAGWPDNASLLLREHDYPVVDHIVHVPDIARLAPGPAKDALVPAALKGWACVTGRTTDGAAILLGFDWVTQRTATMRSGEPGPLRMALDTLANAVGRHMLDQERVRLETRLEHARRLETVGTLASGIAHNFNNILGAILGYVDYANEQHGASHVLDEIRRAAERARELVDQILGFARRREVDRRTVSVATAIDEAASLLRASLPAGIALAVGEVPASVMVRGVAAQLQQVILNLCNNAAQATGNAGRIELDVAMFDLPEARVLSHGALAAGRHVRIAVSDTGRGMDSAVLERVFEPFFTTRAEGNGLGLATTRDIVREHGGAMHAESTVGVGSRFEVWLPCTENDAPATNAPQPLGQGESVLIMEADTERRLRDEEILAALGFEPIGYRDAAEALGACQASPNRFDVILLAHPIAVAEMLELAARLHRVASAVPIVLATSSADAVSAGELMSAGVADVVRWPIAAAEIVAALRDCLRRGGRRVPD